METLLALPTGDGDAFVPRAELESPCHRHLLSWLRGFRDADRRGDADVARRLSRLARVRVDFARDAGVDGPTGRGNGRSVDRFLPAVPDPQGTRHFLRFRLSDLDVDAE